MTAFLAQIYSWGAIAGSKTSAVAWRSELLRTVGRGRMIELSASIE